MSQNQRGHIATVVTKSAVLQGSASTRVSLCQVPARFKRVLNLGSKISSLQKSTPILDFFSYNSIEK